MRLTYLLSLFFISILFVNCSKDEAVTKEPEAGEKPKPKPEPEPEPEVLTYFTIKTGCEGMPNMGYWIILHNEDGTLLDYKSFESESILTFEALETELPEEFTVTSFKVNEYLGTTWYNLNSETEVSKGTVWDNTCNTPTQSEDNPAIGNFSLNINNVPYGNGINELTINNGSGVNSQTYSTSGDMNFVSYSTTLDINANNSDYLITIYDGNDEYNYYWLADYGNGASIAIDYSEFKDFDNYLNIDIPINQGFSFFLEGTDTETQLTYPISSIFSNEGFQKTLKRGFMDLFDTYATIFSIKLDEEYEYKYLKYGSNPNEITIPQKPTLNILNESVNGFEFNINLENYQEKTVYWHYKGEPVNGQLNVTSWSVSSANLYSPIIGNIPEDLLDLFPENHLEDLTLDNAVFKLNEEEIITIRNTN